MKRLWCLAILVGGAAAVGTAMAERARSFDVGDSFKECRSCPRMVVIPAGSFVMGTPSDEPSRQDDEIQHRVTFARPFAVSATEVTWDQWEACVRDRACDGMAVAAALRLDREGQPNPAYVDFGRGNRPVVGVSWYDALAYTAWLNRKTGHAGAYRLLSDAEWEYAARAGTTTTYPWGSSIDHNYGNFGKAAPGLGGRVEGRDRWDNETAPVASFPPNAFGLYDMQGNAFEWLQDCYQADLSAGPFDGSANETGDCQTRMFRSGSFISNPSMHRAGNRSPGYVPTTRGRNYLSIRVARTLAEAPQTGAAKGDQQRHYFFDAAGVEMPYRLFVPQSYDPARKMPLVVALHGYGGDQNYFFAQLETLPALLEQHGFIFAAPLGYTTGGWYGAPLDIPGNRPRNSGQPVPPVTQTPEELLRERALSEMDVMNVLELVRREYNVDPDRVYLLGHSMGGMGTYVLGQKYAEKWAAIAPMSGTLADATYSLDRLRNVAVMLSAGSTEAATVVAAEAQVEQMNKMGIVTGLWIEPGGTHMSMIAPTLPKVLEFFAGKVRR